MEYSYRFRIVPNKAQREQIAKNFGCCRFVFNHFLAERIETYQNEGKSLSWYEQSRNLTQLKKELPWLSEADATSLQSSLRDLDRAYQNFFCRVKRGEKSGFPKFKSKHNHRKSYKSRCTGTNIQVLDGAIKLPKLGRVKCRISKEVKGRILSATISQTASGKYFVSLCCTEVEKKQWPSTNQTIGLELGIRTWLVTSDGIEYSNPKYWQREEKKLARYQRQLSRKTRGSGRREKARIKVARLHEKISQQRKDMLHKVSTKIVKENDVICVREMGIKSMMRKKRFSKQIADASWGEFLRQLEYKARWQHKQIVKVDPLFPSSQLCSECGHKNAKAKELRITKWTCPNCQAEHDREVNAARNIKKEGLSLLV